MHLTSKHGNDDVVVDDDGDGYGLSLGFRFI